MLPSHTWYVSQTNLLQRLTPSEMDFLCQHGQRVLLKRGDALTPTYEEIPSVYVVASGFTRLVLLNEDGRRFSISILGPGDFIGAIAPAATPTAEARVRPAAAEAEFIEVMSPTCEVLRLGSPRFHEILSQNAGLMNTVLLNLQGKAKLFHRKLSDLLFRDVHARIAQLFLDMVFHYSEQCPYAFGLHRDLCLRHHEIAELVGASRPVTSLALGDFAKADLIHKHDGFICLQQIEPLRQVAEGGAKTLAALKRDLLFAT
jgi:CRP-like cAMP-binding protein